MIAIIDSGGANIASIQLALERLGYQSILTHDATVIQNAQHVILPGVGSANIAMMRLKQYNLIDIIRSLTQPVLGICLGMQLLFELSDEGDIPCLNIIKERIKKFTENPALTIPHMGWNQLNITNDCLLLKNIPNLSYVYFVHSFAATVTSYTCAHTYYGEAFSAIVQYHNFYGTQFHPERSGKIGEKILQNFLELK